MSRAKRVVWTAVGIAGGSGLLCLIAAVAPEVLIGIIVVVVLLCIADTFVP